jgi:NRPS condensation-like uncharacterized protein
MQITIPKTFEATATDKVIYITRETSNQVLHCLIEFETQVKEDVLAKTLRLSLDAEPILGCKFVKNDETAFFERRNDLDNLELLIISRTEALKSEEIKEYILVDIDPEIDPLVQAKLFRSKDSDTLCIKGSHIPMDIGGFKEYLSLLSSLYNNLIKDINYKHISNVDGDRSTNQVLNLFDKKQLRSISRKTPRTAPTVGFPFSGRSDTQLNYEVKEIDIRKIKEYQKKNDSTVNDIILTAITRTLFKLLTPDNDLPVIIIFAVDLRKFLANKKAGALANLIGFFMQRVKIEAEQTFSESLNCIKKDIDKMKEESTGLGYTMMYEKICNVPFRNTKEFFDDLHKENRELGKAYPNLSNLGILLPESINFNNIPIIKAFLLVPLCFPPWFLFGFNSFRDSLYFSVGYDDAEAFTPVIEEFFNILENELKSIGVNDFNTII